MDSDFVTADGVRLGANDSVEPDAPIVGGQIGIQHQFGQFVVGIEGSGVFSYNDDYANVTCPNPARTCGKQLDNILSVGPEARLCDGQMDAVHHWRLRQREHRAQELR